MDFKDTNEAKRRNSAMVQDLNQTRNIYPLNQSPLGSAYIARGSPVSTPSTAPAASRNTTPSESKTTGKTKPESPNPPFARLLEASFCQHEWTDNPRKRNRSDSPPLEIQREFQMSDAGSLDIVRDMDWDGSDDDGEVSQDLAMSAISSGTGKKRRIDGNCEYPRVLIQLTYS